MKDYVAVWDIETTGKIEDQIGRFREDKIKLLEISCASIVKLPSELCLDPADRERAMEASVTRTYWADEDGENSMSAMCDALEGAEMIAGFNLCGFDYLVAKKYFSKPSAYLQCRQKTHDPFSRIRDVTSTFFKLDSLLKLNGLATKTADGLIAIKWWHEQKRDLLREYCEVDTQQCARCCLLPHLELGADRRLDNHVFGLASALTSYRFSRQLETDQQ